MIASVLIRSTEQVPTLAATAIATHKKEAGSRADGCESGKEFVKGEVP